MTATHPALAAEQARAAALQARDLSALAGLLDERLRYVHATGACHGREAYLQYVRTGPRFDRVHFDPEQVIELGDAVLLTGCLSLQFQREGQPPQQARSLASAVWCAHGTGWCLLSFQSTRPPEA